MLRSAAAVDIVKPMIVSVLNRLRKKQPAPRTEPGQRIYAIGDIHGRIDLFAALMDMIVADAASVADRSPVLICLGDYIDRGPASDRIIESLIGPPPDGFQTHYLMGNHEDMMLQFIDGTGSADVWLNNGGEQTLAAYDCAGVEDPALIRQKLRANVPARHLAFLRSLKSHRQEGGYLFVHAGIRPGVAIDLQSDTDMMWIREAFLKSGEDFGKIVVHGHTVRPEPEIRANRIGIDTGAWRTGVLTCLVLDGEERKFLST